MSSAAKIERIVDRVRLLASERFPEGAFEDEWFRHIPTVGRAADGGGNPRPAALPFFPFRTLLVTGTAGAGKTSSIQTLAANLDCVITGTTVIASQNLSSILNRTKSAQIKTIYRVFGFNSKHVSMADGLTPSSRQPPPSSSSPSGPAGPFRPSPPSPPGAAAAPAVNVAAAAAPLAPGVGASWTGATDDVRRCQAGDLSFYWRVVDDIVARCLEARDKKARVEVSELCDSNVIVVDECGLLLRHMLHVVVFFYYFYNALHDTPLYRERRVPCVVCVGSPTQTEALETSYGGGGGGGAGGGGRRGGNGNGGGGKNVKRGTDVLSALISDPVLSRYCAVHDNWIMFINNKRCTDLDFSDLLKHIEFGLPLSREHVEYVDRFVRPAGLIRDPAYALDMTRLFISHAEVQRYFRRLHDRLRVVNRGLLFELPVYCVIDNANFEEFCELSDVPALARTPERWFKANLARIINYSQFVDHNISDGIEVEPVSAVGGGGGGAVLYGDDEGAGDGGRAAHRETLITAKITYIKDSSIGVNAKVRSCVIGFAGTYERFVEILQNDTFVERTPCEQAIYAYSLISGLLYSAMYSFYTSELSSVEIFDEFSRMSLPNVPSLMIRRERFPGEPEEEEEERDDAGNGGAAGGWVGAPAAAAASGAAAATHSIPCLEEGSSDYVWGDDVSDAEMLSSSNVVADKFFATYDKPPHVGSTSFEEVIAVYTAFKSIFVERFKIMQRHTGGEFGKTELVTYNRRNVFRRDGCRIASEAKSFVGMLSYASPVNNYVLVGYTADDVLTMSMDRKRIHPRVLEKGLPKLIVKDPLGFLSILDVNVSRFVDTSHGKSLHICTSVDYGVNSRTAMTIAKSQGLSLEKVAIDFGDDPRNLRLSQIYVAMSRVVDPDALIMNTNPMRLKHEKNTYITPYICDALKNEKTTLVF